MSLYIGLMSGTSMDGVDAALVDVASNRLIGGLTRPYGHPARQLLNQVLSSPASSFSTLSQLNRVLGMEFAAAASELLKATAIDSNQINAIGSHGQTMCHDPMAEIPYTVQMGCAHSIAEITGIPVVADFRTRDLIVGGQGAPFAPLYHRALFTPLDVARAVVNIGGVANVTLLLPDAAVVGYDTGPGNCLMDAWISKHLNKPYDNQGRWAQQGKIILPLLESLLSDEYFQQPGPKSIGKEYFSCEWVTRCLNEGDAPIDVQATLLELTAVTVARDIKRTGTPFRDVLICGGGAHNKQLLSRLQHHIKDSQVITTEQVGVSPDFLEAMMFAWLADKTLRKIPLDLSSITGAERPTILGAIYPAVGHPMNFIKN